MLSGSRASAGRALVIAVVIAGASSLVAQTLPTYNAVITPNPATLVIGGPPVTVTVSTTTDPQFGEEFIAYSFSGFPAFIDTGGERLTSAPNYPPVQFTFSLSNGATPGTYAGLLNGTTGRAQVKSFPMTVIVQQPDIAASFAQPAMTLCNGGPAVSNSIILNPVNGYTGTPRLEFRNIPPGITVTPVSPAAAAMPPGQSIPFTVQASGAVAGPQSVTLNISDPNANINKNITLSLNVVNPDFTPSLSPTTLALTAGGGAQQVSASITPNQCFSASSVAVTVSGQPAGMTVSPSSASIAAPSYTPVSFTVQAGANVPSGTYSLNFTFTPAGGAPKSVVLPVTVSPAPDFALTVDPSALSIAAGSSGNFVVGATGINGFQGTVNVTSPSIPDVTFTPAAFTLATGSTQTVLVTVAPGAAPRSVEAMFSGTAAGIGTRTASATLNILAGPDFDLTLSPASLSIAAGSSGVTTVSVTPRNGFNGVVNVQSPVDGDVTFTPSSFTLVPGATQQVTIAVRADATPRTLSLVFTGTAAGVVGPRTATLVLTITPAPDFMLAVTPNALSVPEGGSATATVMVVPLHGFNGSVAVTATAPPGLSVSPASFVVAAGGSQAVTITAADGTSLGTRDVVFTGVAAGVTGTRSATLSVTVSPRPDFSLSIDPPAIAIRAGGGGAVDVRSTAINGFDSAVLVTAPSVPGIVFSPSSFTLAPGAVQRVSITVDRSVAPAASIPLIFTAVGGSPALTRTATLILSILPPDPLVTSVAPQAFVAGTAQRIARIGGEFFQPGGIAVSRDPRIVVEQTRVLTPQLAEIVLTVRAGTDPGRYLLDFVNPDGGRSVVPIEILIYPESSIGAPLDVTGAVIVFPAEGTMIAPLDRVYPRGVLATTGTGTIILAWHFDGVAFDRLIVNAAGGMPVEVRANVPIPISYSGAHRLELVVESPGHAISPAIKVLHAPERVSRLTLFAPSDGAVITQRSPLFRWSLVPNCSGYFVEVAPGAGLGERMLPEPLLSLVRIRVSDSEWIPSAVDLERIGTGIHRWRVRPVCGGDAELEPSPWQRFAVIPDHVALTLLPLERDPSGRAIARWSGGLPGLLYRVDLLSADGDVLFSALTSADDYRFPAAVAIPPGARVRVVVLAPGGRIVGTSSEANISARRTPRDVRLVQLAGVSITRLEPAEGATVRTEQPRIAAHWKGSARPSDISLVVDQTDVTAVATITGNSIVYDALLPLGGGAHTAHLSVGDEVRSWTFHVDAAEAAVAPSDPIAAGPATDDPTETPKPRSGIRTNWAVTPNGTLTATRDDTADRTDMRAQLSAQTDLANDVATAKMTGDVSLLHELDDPNRTLQESRNWLAQLGAKQGDFQEEIRVGFAPPDFLDQSELLSTGFARGGAQGKLFTPIGVASFYETFGTRPVGVVAGNFGPEQRIRAGALQLPATSRWDVRLIGLEVRDEPGFNSAGGKGEAYGIFSRFVVRPSLSIIFEGAQGNFKPNFGSAEDDREGNALRLGVSGTIGTFGYGVALRKTDADYVNPANRGFTPGGVPDRAGGDLMLSKMIGRSSISLQLRRLQDGNASGAIIPRTRQTGGNLSFMSMLGQRVSLALSANHTADHGEERPQIFLPKTDRTSSGVTGTLSESAGRFSFSQTASYQQLRDAINPTYDQTIKSAMASATASLSTVFNLTGMLSGTRSEGSALVGTNDQLLVSLQPMFAIPSLGIAFQPRAMYNWSKSDLTDFETKTQQYQALVTYAPPRVASYLSVQLSSDWNQNRFTGQATDPGFDRRYAATMSLRWGAGTRQGGPEHVPIMPVTPDPEITPSPVATARTNPIFLGWR
jgi:hypothetical protein